MKPPLLSPLTRYPLKRLPIPAPGDRIAYIGKRCQGLGSLYRPVLLHVPPVPGARSEVPRSRNKGIDVLFLKPIKKLYPLTATFGPAESVSRIALAMKPSPKGYIMGIGPKVRRFFGPFESYITELYRAFFIDLGLFTRAVHRWFPDARNILEIGCGEGAISHRLSILYPKVRITGIDITPTVGRLFQGDSSRVAFFRQPIQEFASSHPNEFDLVLICDVLHHVPWNLHIEMLNEGRNALRPGGGFVLKEWEKRQNLICGFAYLCERYLTGDRVRDGTAAEFRREIAEVFGANQIEKVQRFQPWTNNLAFFIRNR